MTSRVFVGFGFGAVQAGLFLYEAATTGLFDRLVVSEVRDDVVHAIRRAGGLYRVNVASGVGLEVKEVGGVEIFNPRDSCDRESLVRAVTQAHEIATALPSVEDYDRGDSASPAGILAEGISERSAAYEALSCVVYAAENNNEAAAILNRTIASHLVNAGAARALRLVQCIDTVIGKMSQVVGESGIAETHLTPMADDFPQAFLVEEFNHILVGKVTLPGFERCITSFEEKADLLPFAEAKLYGHNAAHALLGYLAARRGYRYLSEAKDDTALMGFARDAFVKESGAGLVARHAGADPIFTPEGYRSYAEDILDRMTNPWLHDTVERVTRDPRRQLGWNDRLVGTMRLALGAGVIPWRFAIAAAAALQMVATGTHHIGPGQLLDEIWGDADGNGPTEPQQVLRQMILAEWPSGFSKGPSGRDLGERLLSSAHDSECPLPKAALSSASNGARLVDG